MDLPDKTTPTFESEFTVDEVSFLWKIKNFQDVITSNSVINWQKLDFHAGDKVSLSSDWTIYLKSENKDDGRWVGIFYKMKEKPSESCTELFTQCHVAIKNKDGNTFWDRKMVIKDAFTIKGGWGHSKMIKDNSTLPFLIDGSLVIHVNFKIYSKPNPNRSVEEALQEFQTKAGAKAWADIKCTLKDPASCYQSQLAKLVSSDGVEVTAPRAVLAARNPFFKAILETNMVEGNSGVVQFPNISSPTLKVLLHFLCQGELLPDWSHPEVILELTSAADQYNIDDLLKFLDSTLGRVCTLENVAELLGLATQISLNTAKEDLMRYARQKGFGSPENLIQFLESVRVRDLPVVPSCTKCALADGDKDNENAGEKPRPGLIPLLGFLFINLFNMHFSS